MPIILTCKICKVQFSVKNSRRNTIYCRAECYYFDMKQNGRPSLEINVNLSCEHCSKSFTVNKSRDAAKRRFCSCACRAAWQASLPYDKWRGKLSANRKNRQYGSDNPRYGKPPIHPGKALPYLRHDGATVKFRSSWELKAAIYLDRRSIKWEYEAKRFDLGDTTYVPDFWLPDLGCFWEIKGWFHEKAQAKIASFRRMYPNERLVVLTKGIFGMIDRDHHEHA